MSTVTRMPYAQAQTLRRTLIERGEESAYVNSLSIEPLLELERTTRLTLVADVQDADPDSMPRLGVKLTRQQRIDNMHADACTPDEISATLYALDRMAGHTPVLQDAGLGSCGFGFDGGSAA